MGKRDHLKDYVPSENGGYEYTGTRWSWPSEEVRSEFIGFSARRVGVAVACVIAAGCVPADGTFGAFYIVIPFLIAVVGMALAGAALFRIAREDNPMRDHVYSSSVPALPAKLLVGALGCGICGFAALAHGIALLVVGAGGRIALSVVFAALMAGGAVCLVLLRAKAEGLVFTSTR